MKNGIVIYEVKIGSAGKRGIAALSLKKGIFSAMSMDCYDFYLRHNSLHKAVNSGFRRGGGKDEEDLIARFHLDRKCKLFRFKSKPSMVQLEFHELDSQKAPDVQVQMQFISPLTRANFCGYVSPFLYGISRKRIQSLGWAKSGYKGRTLTIGIISWNVGEGKPKSHENYPQLLRPSSSGEEHDNVKHVDMIVLGMQECPKKYKNKWVAALLKRFNERFGVSRTYDEYLVCESAVMVGISVTLIVRRSIAHLVTETRTDNVPTGIGGVYGNKGAVGIGVEFMHGSRIAFINSHLAARVQRISARAADYRDINWRMKGLSLAKNLQPLDW